MGERSHVRSSPPQTPAATHIEADGEPVAHRRIRRRGPLFVAGALPVAALLVAGPPGSPQQIAAAQTVMNLGTENPADLPDTTNADQGRPGSDVIDPGAADSYTAPDWNFDRYPAAGDDQQTRPAGDDQQATAADDRQTSVGDDQQAPAGDIDEELPAPAAVPDAVTAPDAAAAPDTTPAAETDPGADVAPAGDTAPTPDGMLHIGSTQIGYRGWLPDEAAGVFNQSVAQSEAQLARNLDGAGIDQARSELIATDTLNGAVAGAAAMNAVASPLTITSAAVGAATGFVCGIPFLPIGLLIGPIIGGAIGAAAIAGPATVGGAVLGSIVGAAAGLTAPAVDVPADVAPAADNAPVS